MFQLLQFPMRNIICHKFPLSLLVQTYYEAARSWFEYKIRIHY